MVTIEDQPWFVAPDVRDALGLLQHGKLYDKLLDDEQMVLNRNSGVAITSVLFERTQAPSIRVISESGLYKFIMRSDKPTARAFQDWVTREVLPSIRKTGAYVQGQPSIVENPNMDPSGRPLKGFPVVGWGKEVARFRTSPRARKRAPTRTPQKPY